MPKTVYHPKMILEIYDLARDGLSDTQIAKQLGVSREIFKIWKKKKPSVLRALKRGRGKTEGPTETMMEYVYNRMDPNIKQYYDLLCQWEKDPNFLLRAEGLLKHKGKDVRQSLFIQFLIARSFDASQACRMTGIPKSTLDTWVRSDPRFAELIQEVQWHKQNLLEGQYWKLVKQKSEAMIALGMKSFNAKRGFGETKTIQHEGSIQHDHDHNVQIEQLPIKLRKKVLLALEQGKNPGESIPEAEIITPESVFVEDGDDD